MKGSLKIDRMKGEGVKPSVKRIYEGGGLGKEVLKQLYGVK